MRERGSPRTRPGSRSGSVRSRRAAPDARRSRPRTAGLGDDDYEQLAQFRYALRRFLRESESAARKAHITPGQYQLLLFVRSFYPDSPSVAALAERLQVRHQSAVGLIDRCAAAGLVRRRRDEADARRVRILLTGAGDRRLAQLVRDHYSGLDELRRAMPTAASARTSFRKSRGAGLIPPRSRPHGSPRAHAAGSVTRSQSR